MVTYCAAYRCSVTFENLCYFSTIGQLDHISHNAVRTRFGVKEPAEICTRDKWGNNIGQLHLRHLKPFIVIASEIKGQQANTSLRGDGPCTPWFPHNMEQFEDGVVEYLMKQDHYTGFNRPTAIWS